MVYESDFYTTRRPYRAPNPSYSSYTSSSIVPSRQVRILPGIGKVYVVHSYDRIIPYVGHKRLAVVTHQVPHVFRVRPSVIIREIDRIQHKARPYVYYSPTSHWLNSEPATYYPYYYSWYYPYYPYYSSVLYNYPYYNRFWREIYWSRLYPSYPTHVWSKMFEDETKAIRAQTNALLKRVQTHVPRPERSWPVSTTTVTRRYYYSPDDYYYRYSWTPESTWPSKVTSDDFVYRMLTPIRHVKNDIYNISHYYAEPLVRKLVGGGLACVKYGGDKAYSRRRNLTLQEIYAMQSDAVRGDIQLLSYYIKANKERKMMEGEAPLPPCRPSRKFNPRKWFMECLEPNNEIIELRKQREERLAKIHSLEYTPLEKEDRKQDQHEQRELAEEKERQAEKAKKEEAARKAELARQEALAAQAAADRAAELERKRKEEEEERKRKEEEARKAEEERIAAEEARIAKEKAAKEEAERKAREEEAARIAKEKEEAARLEEEKRLAELARQEEERQQLLRLEEIARQAEEEKEKELARQAEELAALARQEAELAEQARREAELAELAQKEAELMELEKQEKELAELDKKDREAATLAREEKVMAEQKLEVEEIAAAAEAVSSDEVAQSSADEVMSSDEHTAEPVIEEPVTPDVQQHAGPTAVEASSSEVETEEDA